MEEQIQYLALRSLNNSLLNALNSLLRQQVHYPRQTLCYSDRQPLSPTTQDHSKTSGRYQNRRKNDHHFQYGFIGNNYHLKTNYNSPKKPYNSPKHYFSDQKKLFFNSPMPENSYFQDHRFSTLNSFYKEQKRNLNMTSTNLKSRGKQTSIYFKYLGK